MANLINLFKKGYKGRVARVDLSKSLCKVVGWDLETPTLFQKFIFRKLAPMIVEDDVWSLENFFPTHARDYLININESIKCNYYSLLDYLAMQEPDYIDDEILYEEAQIDSWYDKSLDEFMQTYSKSIK
ncbi:hypothetical protein [Campylobacter sp. MG1]|uniref:hypothetical protein n=1 Tax=Campylobacter sp. MG1 TaxID=2976332 RepID=UPI00226CC721|nr:hypothetical protein [Campylobacter sp. MG1]